MKNIAIIPARSGSKGLPNKNIKKLIDKPLMYYSIEAAINSGCFDTVMVSTDSEKYANIARDGGAEVLFLRSQSTSSDTASSWDVVIEVLNRYLNIGKKFDTFCLLQPTSPLRSSNDIIESYRLMAQRDAFSVISVTELDHPLAWCGEIGENLSLDGFIQKSASKQRQLQKTIYRINGAIYIASIPEFLKDQFLYRRGSYAYIMPKERSIDIDTEYDFKCAEYYLQTYKYFSEDK